MRRAVIAAILLAASPAWATRAITTGFEWCDAVNLSTREQFIFNDNSGSTSQAVGTTGDRDNYCDHNSKANRGKLCAANTDCGTGGTCWADPDNDCALAFTPNSEAEWSRIVWDGKASAKAHFSLNITSIPQTLGATAIVAQYGAAPASTDGCLLQAEVTGGTCAGGSRSGADCQSNANCPSSTCTFNEYALRVYYSSTSDTRCASAVNNDTPCSGTATPECAEPPGHIEGEALCLPIILAQAPDLKLSQHYELLFGQELGGADASSEFKVTCSLYESGFTRGSRELPVGTCGVDGWACDALADCALGRCADWTAAADTEGDDYCTTNADCSPSTCTIPRNCDTSWDADVTGSGLVLGATVATTANWTWYVDDLAVDIADSYGGSSADGLKTLRIDKFVPTGDGSPIDWATTGSASGCTSGSAEWECVNDLGTTQDGSASAVDRGAAVTSGTEYIQEASLPAITLNTANGDASTSTSLARPGAFQFTQFVLDDGGRSDDTTMDMQSCMSDGGANIVCPSCSNNTDCLGGLGGAYTCDSSVCTMHVSHQTGASFSPITAVLPTKPGGGQWTGDAIASTEMRGEYTRDGSNTGMQSSAWIGEFDIATTGPTLPGVARDVNTDGIKRLCVTGDSIINDLDNYIAGYVEDFDSIITYTKGGTTLGDIYQNIRDIVDAQQAGYMDPSVLLGSFSAGTESNAGCDYLLVMSGANTIIGGVPAPASYCSASPYEKCSANADCGGGGETCNAYTTGYCRGGSNHGQRCSCPRNSSWVSDTAGSPVSNEKYCQRWVSSPGTYLEPDLGAACNTCSSNTDCATGIPCSTNADCANASGCLTGTGVCDTSITGAAWAPNGQCRAVCSANKCGATLDFSRADSMCPHNGGWVQAGCPDTADCADGLCVGANTVAELESEANAIHDLIDARVCTGGSCDGTGDVDCSNNTDCSVELIWMTQPPPARGTDTVISPGSNLASAHRYRLDSASHALKTLAQARGAFWIDVTKAFRARASHHQPDFVPGCSTNTDCSGIGLAECMQGKCTSGECTVGAVTEEETAPSCSVNADCNACRVALRDSIHHTYPSSPSSGMTMTLEAIEDCLENQAGHRDGNCNDNVCTGGTVGESCTNDADCDTYECVIGSPPINWAASTNNKLLWLMNDSTACAGTPAAIGSGSLGTTCNGTQFSSYARSSTSREGTCAGYNSATSARGLTNATAGCVDVIGSGSIADKSWGGWVDCDQSTSTQVLFRDLNGNSGFEARVASSSGNKIQCRVGNGAAITTAESTTSLTCSSTVANWYHWFCTYDTGTSPDTLKLYVNGALQDTETVDMADSTNATVTFNAISGDNSSELRGRQDEFSIWAAELSATDVCRLCSCGHTGTPLCPCNTVDDSLYQSEGLNDSVCGNCTLPACDASAP